MDMKKDTLGRERKASNQMAVEGSIKIEKAGVVILNIPFIFHNPCHSLPRLCPLPSPDIFTNPCSC